MKKSRFVLPLAILAVILSPLALGGSALAEEPLSACKQSCLTQHQANVEQLLHTPPALGESDPLGRRQMVLNAIDALNNCVQACDLAPEPTPDPAADPAPSRKRRW